MVIKSSESVTQQEVDMEGATGCKVRWLLGDQDNAPNFAMREFTVAPGGHTPQHHHPYEHEVYVLGGNGQVLENGEWKSVKSGDVVLVESDKVHQFKNEGDEDFRFLCLIPNSASGQPVHMAAECNSVKENS